MSNKANIKFSGRPKLDKAKRKVLATNDPIESFSDRGRIVTLPPADEQRRQRLFFHEQADDIVRMFPTLYKRVNS